jgi:hypothetical protein
VAALFDVARVEPPSAGTLLVPDRDVLLPALPTEVQRKDPAGTVTRDELAALQGQVTLPCGFECAVHPLERNGEEWTAERERYLARFPGSRITFRLSDFTLYRLEFRQGLWVGGFGRAVEITPRDVAKLGSHGLA